MSENRNSSVGSILTNEEGYELVIKYVHYYWVTNKFYSLKNSMEEEDVVNEIYLKLLRHDHFKKYDSTITTKKYHVCRAVFTSMVDLLRKHKDVSSLDKKDPDTGLTLCDLVTDTTQIVDESACGQCGRDRIMAQLPDITDSNIKGVGPDGSEINISYRTLAELLESGYSTKEIASFYKNPRTGTPLSEGTVSRYVRNLREYVLDNIVIVA